MTSHVHTYLYKHFWSRHFTGLRGVKRCYKRQRIVILVYYYLFDYYGNGTLTLNSGKSLLFRTGLVSITRLVRRGDPSTRRLVLLTCQCSISQQVLSVVEVLCRKWLITDDEIVESLSIVLNLFLHFIKNYIFFSKKRC